MKIFYQLIFFFSSSRLQFFFPFSKVTCFDLPSGYEYFVFLLYYFLPPIYFKIYKKYLSIKGFTFYKVLKRRMKVM